ncbi:MAG: AAA family ATPase [Aestuariivita sp.]|nr:AAA family ATPase [Aestuariivita sp.]
MTAKELNKIKNIRIKGFRSLLDVEINGLPSPVVLIGANGSGKSNFIKFFDLIGWMIGANKLGEFVQRQGGADDQLFGGSKVNERISAEFAIQTLRGRTDYKFSLSYAHPDRFIFVDEAYRPSPTVEFQTSANWKHLGSGHPEARIVEVAKGRSVSGANRTSADTIVTLLGNCAVYQFHDTSDNSQMKKYWDAYENTYLRSDGGNLAPILLRLEREEPHRLDLICDQIRRALPIFDRFELHENSGKVMLRWKSHELEKSIGAHLSSDGSLRYFALVTLLNLPNEMIPDVVLLDEPELGLHPSALALIGDLIRARATERQIIVATQSPLLADIFDLNEVFVLESTCGQTRVQRFSDDEYRHWLEQYSTGELWQKNLLGGRP